jgi:hypothetical protein
MQEVRQLHEHERPREHRLRNADRDATRICWRNSKRKGWDRCGRHGGVRRKLALAGTVLLGAGLAAAIAIGFLAPFTTDYTPLHIQLAFAAFIGICAGTLVCSIVAALPALETGGSQSAGHPALMRQRKTVAILAFIIDSAPPLKRPFRWL